MAEQRSSPQLCDLPTGAIQGRGSCRARNGEFTANAFPQLPRARGRTRRRSMVQYRSAGQGIRRRTDGRATMTFYVPVQYLPSSKRGSIADSDLRAAWLAELKECDRRRTSLIRRAKRARRSGDRRKFADLNKQLWAMEMASVEQGPPPPGWPTPKFVTLMDRTYEDRNGWLMKDEWDKTVPRRLRNENGRTAWVTLSYWRRA